MPELWRIDNLVLVQRFFYIIGRIEFRSSHSCYFNSGHLLVRGEGASILVLDRPQAALVVHLRPPITAYSSHHLLVPASSQCLHHRGEREGGERHHEIPHARGDGRKIAKREGEREREKVLSKQTPFLTAPPNPNPAVDEQKGSQLDDTNNSST